MSKPTILIVEQDESMLQELVLAFVRTESYNLYSSRSYDGARMLLDRRRQSKRFPTTKPDVIITYYGGIIKDLRRFLHNVQKNSPNTQVVIFSKHSMIPNDFPIADTVRQWEPDSIDILLHRVGLLIYQLTLTTSSSASATTPH